METSEEDKEENLVKLVGWVAVVACNIDRGLSDLGCIVSVTQAMVSKLSVYDILCTMVV